MSKYKVGDIVKACDDVIESDGTVLRLMGTRLLRITGVPGMPYPVSYTVERIDPKEDGTYHRIRYFESELVDLTRKDICDILATHE